MGFLIAMFFIAVMLIVWVAAEINCIKEDVETLFFATDTKKPPRGTTIESYDTAVAKMADESDETKVTEA